MGKRPADKKKPSKEPAAGRRFVARSRSAQPQKQQKRPVQALRRPPGPSSRPRPAEIPEETLLTWSVHLARQYPRRTMWLALGIVGTALLFLIARLGFWWMALTLVIIIGSISAWVFPIHYTLTNKSIKMNNFLSREDRSWLRFTNYVVYNDAVQVLYDQRTIRGRILKGLMLYYGADNRDRIIEIVKDNVVTEEQLAALAMEEDEKGR